MLFFFGWEQHGPPQYMSTTKCWGPVLMSATHEAMWNFKTMMCGRVGRIRFGSVFPKLIFNDENYFADQIHNIVFADFNGFATTQSGRGQTNVNDIGKTLIIARTSFELSDMTNEVSNTSRCSSGGTCFDLFTPPFGETNTLTSLHGVHTTNLPEMFIIIIWSTSDDNMYDITCKNKRCIGHLSVFSNHLTMPLRAFGEVAQAGISQRGHIFFLVSPRTMGEFRFLFDSLFMECHSQNMSRHTFALNGGRYPSDTFTRDAPDIIMIASTKEHITNVVSNLKHDTTVRPSIIVAMNLAQPIREGGNFENIVQESEFVPIFSINCVMFPSYWNPNLSPLDKEAIGHGYTSNDLLRIGAHTFSLPNNWLSHYHAHLYFTYTWTSGDWLRPSFITWGASSSGKRAFLAKLGNTCSGGNAGLHMVARFRQQTTFRACQRKFNFCRSQIGDMAIHKSSGKPLQLMMMHQVLGDSLDQATGNLINKTEQIGGMRVAPLDVMYAELSIPFKGCWLPGGFKCARKITSDDVGQAGGKSKIWTDNMVAKTAAAMEPFHLATGSVQNLYMLTKHDFPLQFPLHDASTCPAWHSISNHSTDNTRRLPTKSHACTPYILSVFLLVTMWCV